MNKTIEIKRETKETQIKVSLNLFSSQQGDIKSGLPFFDHMLRAMSFHGQFFLQLEARGDIEVDPHHLVEDTGIVLGKAFFDYQQKTEGITRYGNFSVPMDDALTQVVIDAANRPYLIYQIDYPQNHSGNFDMSLLKEFFLGFCNNARINLHCLCHYGENSHHIAEALFKSFGKSLKQAYFPAESNQIPSTKGIL